jgi:hypothetical protein
VDGELWDRAPKVGRVNTRGRKHPVSNEAQWSIKTEGDFQRFMEAIDRELIAKGVPVFQRPGRSVEEAAAMLDMDLPQGPLPQGLPHQGDYLGASLSRRILDWVEARYGERLKIDSTLGAAVAVLRGDAWLIRIPMMLGDVQIVYNRDLTKDYPNTGGALNAVQMVKGMTAAVAKSLSKEELNSIHAAFEPAKSAFVQLLDLTYRFPLAEVARVDLMNAAEICVRDPQRRGLSRWYSLQAVEKLLKLYIEIRGQTYPKTHDLIALSTRAAELGGSALDDVDLRAVQCSAGIRYEPEKSSLNEAATAHAAAVRLSRTVLSDIQQLVGPATTWLLPIRPK